MLKIPARSRTTLFGTLSCQVIPKMCRRQCIWNMFNVLSCCAQKVQDSLQYRSKRLMESWYKAVSLRELNLTSWLDRISSLYTHCQLCLASNFSCRRICELTFMCVLEELILHTVDLLEYDHQPFSQHAWTSIDITYSNIYMLTIPAHSRTTLFGTLSCQVILKMHRRRCIWNMFNFPSWHFPSWCAQRVQDSLQYRSVLRTQAL